MPTDVLADSVRIENEFDDQMMDDSKNMEEKNAFSGDLALDSGMEIIENFQALSGKSAERENSKYTNYRENKILRSALVDDDDDDEFSFEVTEYTESDDDSTYYEGTYIHSHGTFEDTMSGMKVDEAIDYAMAAAKRAELQVVVFDSNIFERQIADFHERHHAAAVATYCTEQQTYNMDSTDECSAPSEELSITDVSEYTIDSESETESVNVISDNDEENNVGGTVDDISNEESPILDLQPYDNDDTAGEDLLSDSKRLRRQSQIRPAVERIVRELAPDVADNLDALFVQFADREEELLKTLYIMRDRRVNRRVHVVERERK